MEHSKLTHGSLFSGIGGFELGAEMAGIKTLWNCEIEKFQGEILKNKFPYAERFTDITKTTGLRYVDIISGGFPCQDISVAGKREGIKGERSGLWSEMYRIIREVRPKYVIVENSPALTISGLEQVLCDLSEIGYYAEWKCIQNKVFGFPHNRERLYCIAYDSYQIRREKIYNEGTIFNPKSRSFEIQGGKFSRMSFSSFWTEDYSEFLRMDDGISYNVHRLEAIGNAVNPVVAGYIFDCIKEFDKQIAETINNE